EPAAADKPPGDAGATGGEAMGGEATGGEAETPSPEGEAGAETAPSNTSAQVDEDEAKASQA
ncbi:MAG: hypothetical protein ACE5Q3_00215, partial [Alphaproteobacteria bacterium]